MTEPPRATAVGSATAGLAAAVVDDDEFPESVRRLVAGGAPIEEIRLDARGRWSHRGEPFLNERLTRLFHRSVSRTGAGTWVLRISGQIYPIVVEETRHFVERISGQDAGAIAHFATGEAIPFRADLLSTDGAERIYLLLDADGPARLVGSAHQRILDCLELSHHGWRILWNGASLPVSLLAPDKEALPASRARSIS